jgi:hypothetical protein
MQFWILFRLDVKTFAKGTSVDFRRLLHGICPRSGTREKKRMVSDQNPEVLRRGEMLYLFDPTPAELDRRETFSNSPVKNAADM